MRWLWNILKALPLGLGAPRVIGAASIGPEEAASNLSKWAHRLGLHNLPAWLSDKGADRHAILGAIVFAIVYSALAFVVPKFIRDRRRANLLTPDVNLVFESRLANLPDKAPPEGEVATLPLYYSLDEGTAAQPIGLAVRHARPGSDLDRFSDLKFPQVYRCEVTNYGNRPLLQVCMKIKVEYREPQGEVVYSYQWPVLFPKIDPGKSNMAIFYVYNQSRYLASVSPPNIASYIALGEDIPRKASVSLIGMVASMPLWPVEKR